MTEEIGLKQPVEYTDEERRTIATHEAGHATVAYLVGQNRKLEVLSIIKRRDALGLLSHSDGEERFTRTRSELLGHDEDRVRRHERRGAVLRRVGDGPVGRPRARDAARRADGRLLRHGRFARVVRRDRGRPVLAGHRGQGARQRRRAHGRREAARAGQGRRAGDARRQPPSRRSRCATSCWRGRSSSATRSSTCCARPKPASVSTTGATSSDDSWPDGS